MPARFEVIFERYFCFSVLGVLSCALISSAASAKHANPYPIRWAAPVAMSHVVDQGSAKKSMRLRNSQHLLAPTLAQRPLALGQPWNPVLMKGAKTSP